MKNSSFQVSDYGNLLIYDRKYSAADVKFVIETNRLNGLKIFDFWDPLPSLDFLRQFTFLKELRISCRYDQDFSFLTDLPQLNLFTVGPSFPMKNQIDLSSLVSVKYLSIQWATNRISGLEACHKLRDLCLVEFPLKDLRVIKDLTELIRLRIKTGSIKSLSGVRDLRKLAELEIGNCRSLLSVNDLNGLPALKSIRIESCRKIEDYKDLRDLQKLNNLQLINCGSIPAFDYQALFPLLERSPLIGNTKIRDSDDN